MTQVRAEERGRIADDLNDIRYSFHLRLPMRWILALLFIPSLAYGVFQPVRRDALNVYLPMTEGEGTMLRDHSVHRGTGTLVGTVAWVKDPGGYAQAFGTTTFATTIDGAVYLTETAGVRLEYLPNSARISNNTDDFSIMFVASIEKMVNQMLIMKYVGGAGAGCGGKAGWGVVMLNFGRDLNFANCGGAENITFNVSYPNALPNMWVITRSGNNLKLYLNGKLVGTGTLTSGLGESDIAPLIIGDADASVGIGEFIGKIGPIAIWEATLTPEEVSSMWERFRDIQ